MVWPELLFGARAPFIVNSIITLIPALAIGYLCTRTLEGLPFSALGAGFRPGWTRNLMAGIALGFATLVLAATPGIVSGRLSFSVSDRPGDNSLPLALLSGFVLFAVAAAFEEAFFRGYIFQTLVRADLAAVAIALTSIFFAILHLENPNAGVFSTLNTIIAGIWFGIAYLKTRDLWFVWGLHLMWNFTQASLFGIEVSGLSDIGEPSLLSEYDIGPTWLTGGNYGLEASGACTIALTLSLVFISKAKWLKPDAK